MTEKMEENTKDTTTTCNSCGATIYQNELCDCKKTEEYNSQIKFQDDTTSLQGTQQQTGSDPI